MSNPVDHNQSVPAHSLEYADDNEVVPTGTAAEQRAAIIAAENSVLQQPIHNDVILTFHDRMKRIKLVLFVMLIVGMVNGIISPMIPMLQEDAYGDDMFAYSGFISAGKGFLAGCYAPMFGAISDKRGRKSSLAMTMLLSVIPLAAFFASGNFWVYAMCDMVMGMYSTTFSLCMAVITDRIPRACGMRAESFGMCVCVFFLGMGLGPFVGIFVKVDIAFLISLILQFLGGIFVVFGYPSDDPREMQNERAGLLANAASGAADAAPVCPFGPHPSSGKKVAAGVPPACTIDFTAAANVTPEEQEAAAAAHAEAALAGDPSSPELRTRFDAIARLDSHPRRIIAIMGASSNLVIIFVAIMFNNMCVQLMEQLLMQYFRKHLNFTGSDQAVMIAIMAGTALVSLIVFVPLLKRKFGLLTAFKISLVGNFFQALLTAFVATKWQGYSVQLLGFISMCAYPCASALAAASVSDELAGTAQGVATSARQIADGISPLAFGLMLQATKNTIFPGAPFVVGAGCVLISFVASLFYKFKAAK